MKTARCFQVMGSTTEERSGESVTVCSFYGNGDLIISYRLANLKIVKFCI